MIRKVKLISPQKLFLLTFLTIVLIVSVIYSQNKSFRRSSNRLELIHADVSRGIFKNGRLIRVLEGHVQARQDTLELYCDKAIYDEKEKKITLTDNVRLLRGKDTLTAKQITYFELQQVAVAEGNVQVNRPGQFLRSDYLEYYYKTDQMRASGHLILFDKENRITITAKRGEYIPEKKTTFVEKKAHLIRLDSTQTDTIHIFSHRMEYIFDENRRAIARDSVHFIQQNLHATADSAIYFLDEDIAYLEIEPRAIQENNELFGKQMKLIMENLELKEIHVLGAARTISVEDSLLEKENRLEGQEIILYISDGKLYEIRAISNAQSIYYLKEDDEERGINVVSADTIKVFFVNNELDSIMVIGGSQGIYYPENYKGIIELE